MHLTRTFGLAALFTGLTAIGFIFSPAIVAAGDAPATDRADEGQAAERPRVFELRVYTAAPGKMAALHKRFREHTVGLFEKHGIQSVGYWTADGAEGDPDRLYYIVAYPDLESREKSLVRGIAADPEFLRAVAESEADGKLTDAIESLMLTPTDYSPLR